MVTKNESSGAGSCVGIAAWTGVSEVLLNPFQGLLSLVRVMIEQ